MPASISTERIFSVLGRVKIKLRNSLSDEKMPNLVILSFYPGMVLSMHIILLCNKFAEQTSVRRRREKWFSTFVEQDLKTFYLCLKNKDACKANAFAATNKIFSAAM